MGNMEYNLDPWNQRAQLPRLPVWSVLVIMIGISFLSGFFSLSTWLPVALFLSISLYAFLLVFVRHPIVLAVPIGSYLIAYFVSASHQLVTAFLSVAYVPLAVILAVCLFRSRKCSRTVLWLTLALVLMTAGFTAFFLYNSYGSVVEGGITFWNEVEATCREAIVQVAQAQNYPDSLQSIYTEYLTSLDTMVSSMIYFVPGVLIFCSMSIAWLSCKFVRKLILWVHAHDFFFYKNWNIMVPIWWVYAYIGFTVSSLVVAFLSDDISYYGSLIISNFLLILEAPLFVIGCRRARIIRRRFRANGAKSLHVLSTIIGIFLIIFQLRLFILGVAFIGMYYVYRRSKMKKIVTDTNDPQNPSDNSGDESE